MQAIIFRPRDLAAELELENVRLRLVMRCSIELLQTAPPDTFLGRQNHAPVPLPHEEE